MADKELAARLRVLAGQGNLASGSALAEAGNDLGLVGTASANALGQKLLVGVRGDEWGEVTAEMIAVADSLEVKPDAEDAEAEKPRKK